MARSIRFRARGGPRNFVRCTLATERNINLKGVSNVGKYVLGWVLGVPVIVLVIVYMLFN